MPSQLLSSFMLLQTRQIPCGLLYYLRPSHPTGALRPIPGYQTFRGLIDAPLLRPSGIWPRSLHGIRREIVNSRATRVPQLAPRLPAAFPRRPGGFLAAVFRPFRPSRDRYGESSVSKSVSVRRTLCRVATHFTPSSHGVCKDECQIKTDEPVDDLHDLARPQLAMIFTHTTRPICKVCGQIIDGTSIGARQAAETTLQEAENDVLLATGG